jgi:hypothetical protein
MTRIALQTLLVSVIVMASACAGIQDQLVGSWTIDVDAMLTHNKQLQPEGSDAMARETLKKAFSNTRIIFDEDTFTFLGPKPGDKEIGKYRVVKTDGTEVFLDVDRTGANQRAGWRLEFLDDDHLKGHIASEKEQAIYLQRVTP